MFGKKKKEKCARCGFEMDKSFSFCPKCGMQLRPVDYKEDDIFSIDEFGFNTNAIMAAAMKMANNIMKEFENNMEKPKKEKDVIRSGISINIKSDGGNPQIKITPMGEMKETIKVKENIGKTVVDEKKISNKLTKQQVEQLSKLPKEEPATKIRRLTDKIIYEIDLPGVKEKDIFVQKLKNSIEIKAMSKDKAFFKLIPINLPILNYSIQDNKLILELKPED